MINLQAAEKHYQSGMSTVKALNGVDLEISRGEFIAITGRSGSGKSTLLNVLGCMDRLTGGSYALAGEDISRLDDDRLSQVRSKHIGFVFQSFHLLPRLTALQNVMLPLRFSDAANQGQQRALELLSRVGLEDRIDHRPNELSGGQRQRVAIARALINQPEVILADEPTGNLDSTTSDAILQLIHELHQDGQTVIVVTHEPEVAQEAQRHIRLLDGQVHP